jgi:S-adenosylmethionine synthetase
MTLIEYGIHQVQGHHHHLVVIQKNINTKIKLMIRTAECVSPMHPDKMCDRISDTLLDLHLTHDPESRVAIETAGGNGLVYITGEVTSEYKVSQQEIEDVVREVTKDDKIAVIINLNTQSPEIAQGVDGGGAGDQGIMIGYACEDNDQYLPQEYFLSRELNKFVFNKFPFDGKTQVTIINNKALRVVCSFQNAPRTELYSLVNEFFQERFPQYVLEQIHINPAGDWTIGGFTADAGLTGRKLAVDNYGPRVPIGGGAFSGKDATKVDRSAAYMARRIAVDYCKLYGGETFVTLAYAIGYDEPLQATVSCDGHDMKIEGYDLSPQGIIEFLDLRKPIFKETAAFGHMGCGFNWK